jgi:hypothetical protein
MVATVATNIKNLLTLLLDERALADHVNWLQASQIITNISADWATPVNVCVL